MAIPVVRGELTSVEGCISMDGWVVRRLAVEEVVIA